QRAPAALAPWLRRAWRPADDHHVMAAAREGAGKHDPYLAAAARNDDSQRASVYSSPRVDPAASPKHSPAYLFTLSLGALGVVYGDIGTSPLYALRECFHMQHGVGISHENILGILSLIFWSLVIVISV